MRYTFTFLKSTLLFSLGLSWNSLALSQTAATAYIGPVSQKVTIYRVDAASPAVAQTLKKIQEAAQKDPTWFQEHTRKAKPGQPLPYDKKLGVTEKEFQDFLKGTADGSAMKLMPAGEAKLDVKADGKGLSIVVKGKDIDFKSKLDEKSVLTVDGFKTTDAPQKFANDKSPMGSIEGFSWKSEEVIDPKPDTITGNLASVQTGKIKQENVCFFSADLKKIKNAKPLMREEFTVKYPCPKA